MEIRVTVPDAASAKGLVQRLAIDLDPTSVSLDADRSEVHIETGQVSDQTSLILGTVEDWLEQATVDSVTVSLDGSSYMLAARPAQIASGQ